MSLPQTAESKQPATVTEGEVFEKLKECYDPELPVNVVDLGLIYDIKIIDDWVGVKMTLTTPGCGMGNQIANTIREKLLRLRGIKEADVRIVWQPQWNPSMMSPDAKKRLGMK